jgi:hypothetical protein
MVNLTKQNPHWEEGYYYEFEKKRALFHVLLQYIEKRQIIAITGLRRTGKTVLMKQLINWLIREKHIKRQNILYFSFDEKKAKIDDVIQEYAALAGVDLKKEKVFVFFDEIQKLEGWQEQIKLYYDNFLNLKFIISGSQSLFIRKKSRESLAGRIFSFELPILSFREYLYFVDKHTLLKNTKMFEDEIKRLLITYMKRSFIEILNESDSVWKLYLESILDKVIYEDIPAIFPVENPEKLKALVQAVYSNPGMLIKYESLASDFNISSKTLQRYIYYLEQAKLIKKLYNFSKNFLTSEKKSKKIYITAPCFCFFNESYNISKIAENIVALGNNIKFFWRDSRKNEVDFVINLNGKPHPVEVKYKDKIKRNEIKPLILFMKKFNTETATVVTKGYEASEEIKEKKIQFLPLWKFLLNSF